MKKIIATALCLTITTPCFAAGRYYEYYPQQPAHNMQPRYENRYEPHQKPPKYHHHNSSRTKTLAVVAGVGVAAAIISAIID